MESIGSFCGVATSELTAGMARKRLTRQTVAAIEKNEHSHSLEAALRIGEVFGVVIGDVFQTQKIRRVMSRK